MNRLIEDTMDSASDNLINKDDEVDTNIVVDPTYGDAINSRAKAKKELDKRSKEQEKNKESFIKDNHNKEFKPKGTKELKKMKLSESLFEDTDFGAFGDPTAMGRGACSPLAPDFTRSIKDYVKHLDDSDSRDFCIRALKGFAEALYEAMGEQQAFNSYWTARYPAVMKYIEDQLAMIPSEILDDAQMPSVHEDIDDDIEGLDEFLDASINVPVTATVTANGNNVPFMNGMTGLGEDVEKDPHLFVEDVETEPVNTNVLYYKKKRQPLADIIQRELTSGEVVYKVDATGKRSPTHAPSLNLDDEDIGITYIGDGTAIEVNVPSEDEIIEVENIAKKYGKKTDFKYNPYVAGDKKYSVYIYLDDKDWDEPYFDPDAPVINK